jgi:hypothetical protein
MAVPWDCLTHLNRQGLISMTMGKATASTTRRSTVARLSAAVGRAWTDARLADRRLMELRTDLTRHAGAGS